MTRIDLQSAHTEPDLFAFLEEKRGYAANFNVFRAMANCPDILRAFIPMADAVREGYGIDPVLRELAVIQTCRTVGSAYEHDRHWNLALSLGADRDKLCALWDFENDPRFSDLERAVLRLARDATRAPDQVSAEVWDEVRQALGERQALALLFSIAWYNLTARITGPLALESEPDFVRR